MIKKYGMPVVLSAVLGAELLLLLDAMLVFFGGATSLGLAAVLWLALTAGMGLLLGWNSRRIGALILAVPLVLAAAVGTGIGCWYSFSSGADYEFPDEGKARIYGDRKVMLIVPHQDDDLNILGGVLEEYARYGSKLYPVFVTNGDYGGVAEVRYQEAMSVFAHLGVPAEQMFFLGYGDSWKEDGPHIYNAESGVVMESYSGYTATYGTALHPAYREGRPYTIDNMMEDLESVILEIRPEVVFCSDYDSHIDHRSTTLLFDKVMGRLLKEQPDYRPVVYKAYAYGTAWEAEPDYYADNIASTRNPFEPPYSQWPALYRWEERTRFPVSGATMSRSLIASEGYEMLLRYYSQGAQLKGAAVLNGDKVAWQRRTDSLCLRAAVTVSSGDGSRLQDFMLMDHGNLTDGDRKPYDGVWTPEKGDQDRCLTVVLEEPSALDSIVLYDHPALDENVRNAVITFDDGTVLETGPLDPDGAATKLPVLKENVSSFSIALTETEGEQAGLSEVEAFAQPWEPEGSFVKLTDGQGNFLYDYTMPVEGQAVLSVYAQGQLPALSQDGWVISTGGGEGTAVLEGDGVRVTCPPGEQFELKIANPSAGVSDSIVVRNPGAWERFWTNLWQQAEKQVYDRYSRQMEKKLLIPSTLIKISHVLRHAGA